MLQTARHYRSRAKADQQIRKFGAPAVLRRASGDRACWAAEVQINANERNAMKNFKTRVFIISVIGLDVPPAKEDSLITYVQPAGTVELPPLRQVAPVAPLESGGITIYWELQVEG